VLPDDAETELRRTYEPLLAYLVTATGLRFDLHIPADYEALVDAFDAGSLDLVWFGGLTFAQAEQRSGARPLVSRDIDASFTSAFVAVRDAAGNSLGGFASKPFAFGPRLSTSGHLMPLVFLGTRGINPEAFFGDVRHSRSHGETIEWVRDGVVAVGAINGQILEAAWRSGRIERDALKILATTPPYQNYVWATRETLDPGLRQQLRMAFLALDPADPEHAALLATHGARGYIPVAEEAYASLREVSRTMGLLEPRQ
jgi:phosphonate transport system substrate-binding protein